MPTGGRPNILYLHSHDTGRYIQPYGHQVPTPNIQRLADQGMLFRDAFCAAPSCSGSRASLLTGQWTHCNGMTGLAHRGWKLNDYSHHLLHTLLLIEHGIYILESLDLEGIARAGVREFLFVALPLAIRGATGSMVDPVAIV